MTAPLRVGLGPFLDAGAGARLRARAGDDVVVAALPEPLDPAAAHLVVDGPDRPDDGLVDVRVRAGDVDALWERRIAPFAHLLARQQRAPRAREVAVVPHDDAWAPAARRLGRRLAAALGEVARCVEHVGSTSVPGLAGKDLVDLLVVVPGLDAVDALDPDAWHRAGVVPVPGAFYGIDRHDREHPQRVAVDADPGRPVNVHLHPEESPVWRELLAFRDWLRADEAHRREYVDLKHRLVRETGGDVDAYSRAKRAWVNDAVARALG